MKFFRLFFFLLYTHVLVAQTDSIPIKQIDSLLKVSRALTGKQEIDKALEVNGIAEKLALEKLGRESASYGSACLNHGKIMLSTGDNIEAEKWYLLSKDIREKVFGKEHPDYAKCLSNLAILYYSMGQYSKAEPFCLEAKNIVEKALGKEHAQYAQNLNILAALYSVTGQFEQAEALYLESKAIRGKVLGKDHPEYSDVLNNLGVLYMDMGQYEKAEALFQESIGIRLKAFGKEHPDYANSLNNLAMLNYYIGNKEKSETLYIESISIREKVLGKEHPEYANSLNNLASLYSDLGQYEKAETLYLESNAILEKVLGKDHPYYTNSLHNLGALYFNMGKYEKAEVYYLESKAIRENVLGKEHPAYANSLMGLANLYFHMGQFEKAETLYTNSSQLNKNRILSSLHYLSEKEINQYILTFEGNQADLFSFNQVTNGKNGIAKTCYDNTLFFKGFLLNTFNQSKQLMLPNKVSAELNNQLKSIGQSLSAEYSKPISERKGVTELEEKSNAIEKELAQTVAGYGNAMKQVNWHEVQQKLKANAAAIEFVHYRYVYKKYTDSIMYAALVLKSGDIQPRFIVLFEEKSIDSLLQTNKERKADYVNGLYTLADRGAIAIQTPKRSLYEILWKPLENDLNGINVIYFSPSGLLHRINLDAIPVSSKETLADKYQLIELNSTRQLVIPNQIKNSNNDAVLYGGIQFDQDSTLLKTEPSLTLRSRGELSFRYIDSTLRGGSWNYLPGTEEEVNSIGKILKASKINVKLKKGYDATEESFKNIGANNTLSPRILHISTHGYFFQDPKEKVGSYQLAVGSLEPVFKLSAHPMLRSGLILAGGNAAWQGKRTMEGREDGILTAYEISQMNLSNTELVVLSACETGLGEIQGNEGVYGLQRAFKIAGAKYLIMSLWQVPDKQTSLLMTAFYKNWLNKKMTIPNAFHSAQKELRDLGLDPYQWAGFVLVE